MRLRLKSLKAVRDGKGIETRAFNVTTGKTTEIFLEDGMEQDKRTKKWVQVTTAKAFVAENGQYQVINLDNFDVYFYEIAETPDAVN